jgi:NAD-dependent oxidoreductase involved in siderophore biosynthesis
MSPHPNEEETKTTDAKNVVVPVQVAFGIVITLMVLIGSATIASVWWASRVSAQLETLVHGQTEQIAATLAHGIRITALELWKTQMDSVGSPQMVKRTDELTKEVISIREEFNLHKATTMKP